MLQGRYVHNGADRTISRYLSDVGRYRFLILHLAGAQLRAHNRRTFLGVVWDVATPILLAGIFALVLGPLFGGGDQRAYILYVLTGVIVFDFLSNAVSQASGSLYEAEPYLRQARVPSVVFPLKNVIYLCVTFTYGFLGFVAAFAVLQGVPLVSWLWLPVAIAAFLFFLTPAAILSALLGLHVPDYRSALRFLLLLLYYLSPVFIPKAVFERNPQLAAMDQFNPVTAALDAFRGPLLYGGPPPVQDLLVLLSYGVVFWIVAVLWVRRADDRIVFRL